MAEFDNKNRTRYYGLRVGDIVKYRVPGDEYEPDTYIVVHLMEMDNNRVLIQNKKTGEQYKAVAEWCQIVTKIEDINTVETPFVIEEAEVCISYGDKKEANFCIEIEGTILESLEQGDKVKLIVIRK